RKPWDADRYVGEAHRSESGATQSPAPTIAAPPLHARHSYKATKNIGKLLQEASASHARFAAIIESAEEASLKDLATGTQERVKLADLAARVARPA
ncbi:MAG: hypothetical protein ACKVW3_14800, partial [Phycisphaerales bacterium]